MRHTHEDNESCICVNNEFFSRTVATLMAITILDIYSSKKTVVICVDNFIEALIELKFT